MTKLKPFWAHQKDSFIHAFEGLGYNFQTQPHFRFHIIIAITVILLGFMYGLKTWEWIVIILLIALVTCAEAMNTAIEETCNLLHPETHPHARIAKHCAAASVLILSIASVIIGVIIFFPKI